MIMTSARLRRADRTAGGRRRPCRGSCPTMRPDLQATASSDSQAVHARTWGARGRYQGTGPTPGSAILPSARWIMQPRSRRSRRRRQAETLRAGQGGQGHTGRRPRVSTRTPDPCPSAARQPGPGPRSRRRRACRRTCRAATLPRPTSAACRRRLPRSPACRP